MNEILNIVPAWQFFIFAAIFGAMWGSFANVVIVRWPKELSVVKPASHCFSCKTPIKFFDNIPIFSYIILRGKCRNCKTSFSPRYMFVELIMALLSVAVINFTLLAELGTFESSFQQDSSFQQGAAQYFIWFAFVWALITIAMIDLKHYLIPDAIVLPGILVGIAANSVILDLGWMEPLIASVGGYVGMRLLFIDGYKFLTGKPGMGEGDAKLIAMFGAFLGYQGVFFALFAGAAQGLVVGIIMVLLRRKGYAGEEPVFDEELNEQGEPLEQLDNRFRKAKIPFGPFLAIGAIEYLFFGNHVLSVYIRTLDNIFGSIL